LISGDVKMQGQIVRDGFRTCLMVFWIVAGVVAGVVTGGDEVYHHSSTRVIAGVVRAHLNARGTLVTLCWGKKPYLSMAGVVGVRQLGPCARVWLPPSGQRRTDVFHGASRKTHGGGALGRILFITAESHSLGGGQTAPRKMDVDVATTTSLQNLPPRVAGHTCDGMRLRRGRGTRNPEKGIEGGRRGGAFIKKVWIRKWYDDSQPPVANEVAGLGIFEWRTICFSPFNLQSNFVSRISPSTVIQIWWYLFLNVSKSTYIHLWHFYVCNSISWMLFIHLILFHISTA
jgi:hypothetical protein